jgi:hypothetical protein
MARYVVDDAEMHLSEGASGTMLHIRLRNIIDYEAMPVFLLK